MRDWAFRTMTQGTRILVFLVIGLAVAWCSAGCATEQTYPLAGHPGWVVKESATPLTGFPDDATTTAAADCSSQPWPGQQKGPPLAPCGMTDATTSCSEKAVRLWWYARPGALDHELEHVAVCP